MTGGFSPFPHGTRTLSVVTDILALEGGPPCFPQDFSGPVVLRLTAGGSARLATGLSPPAVGLSRAVRVACYFLDSHIAGPTTPHTVARIWFGLVRVRSPLLTESRLISVPRGTEMFQFPRCPSTRLWIQRGIRGYGPRGLPHSETHGSSLARSSPCTFRRDPRPSSVRDA